MKELFTPFGSVAMLYWMAGNFFYPYPNPCFYLSTGAWLIYITSLMLLSIEI